MNEAETRAEHIDPALKAAGWGVVEGSRVLREHGITLGRLQGGGGMAAWPYVTQQHLETAA
jgi:type I restriction enzyme R subunit